MLQAQVFRFVLPSFLTNPNLSSTDMLKLKGLDDIDPYARSKKPTHKKKKKKRKTNK